MATPTKNSPSLRFGVFQVDLERGELRKFGTPVKIQEKPFRLLVVLLERSGEIVSRDELRERLWPADTFVEFDDGLNAAVKKLRLALNDSADRPHFIETVPKHGYRFVAPLVPDQNPRPAVPNPPVTLVLKPEMKESHSKGRLFRFGVPAAAAGVLFAAGTVAFLVVHPRPVLTEKDTVVLADFVNSTGDPVFDGALRQGLAVQLEQSPFLSLISDARIQQTLRLMDKPADVRLTPEIAREVCERTGSAAVLNGSIAEIGTRYLLTLNASRCSGGERLASTEAQASDKNHVLDALGKLASDIRNKLGESLSTARKFDTPLEQATTPSLEALQAYSFGRRAMSGRSDWFAALPFFQRAVSLDPNFAIAYARLGMAYRNVGQPTLGAQYAQKAYQLRERASESERYYIDSHYYMIGVRDLEKARQVLELWTQTYPRDFTPRVDFSDGYILLGQYGQALAAARDAARFDTNGVNYGEIAYSDICMDRLQEASSAIQEAQAKRLDSPGFHFGLYRLAFLQNDASGMAQQVTWATGKPGSEDILLAQSADTKAYFGQLGKARDLSRRAVESAEQAEESEVAAGYQAEAAFREAVFGNPTEARHWAEKALTLSNGREVEYQAALALAMASDAAKARTLADDLARRFPDDTIVRLIFVSALRAQLALSTQHPSEALEAIQTAAPYELGSPHSAPALYPVYVRGLAYLTRRKGPEAAAEFQKVIGHRGIVVNNPIGALAHLQLARAYALSGDKSNAIAAYQQFLTLWKDADRDIPVLKQAKAEYAKLN